MIYQAFSRTMIAAILLSFTAVGCNQQNGSDVARVTTSLKMTGSGQNATVAMSMPQKLFNLAFPSAWAFVPVSILDATGATVSLSSAWIIIKQIEFETSESSTAGEVEGNEVEFVGPYAVDLLSTAPLTLDTQAIPQLPYKRIKMKLHKAENAVTGAPAQLINNSIYFAGTVGVNAFTYESDDTTEFEIGGASPVLPSDGASLMVQVQLANIFKQIDLSSLPNGAAVSASNRYPGVNLCPSIDASATDIYTCIRLGLRKHADWGKDVDDDDDLDANDDSVRK